MKITNLILSCSLLFLAVYLHSQPLEAEINKIAEYRSSLPLSNELRMKIFMGTPGKYVDGQKIKISEALAIDENGDSLQLLHSNWEYYASPTSINLKMELPARSVKRLKEIKGKVNVFRPKKETNIQIKNFLSRPNQNLLKPKAHPLKVAVVQNLEQDSFFEAFSLAYKKSLRDVYPNISDKDLEAHFEMIEVSKERSRSADQIIHIIADDQEGNMLRLKITDSSGQDVVVGGIILRCPMNETLAKLLHVSDQDFQHLTFQTLTLKEKLSTDWSLEVQYVDPVLVTAYDFAVFNIILP
ncbi:MAG: hypothetical protein HRU41_20520 [Saprospiraceae bacterium]|nr:hypothetical protein [Saprospiraceae bacterium]